MVLGNNPIAGATPETPALSIGDLASAAGISVDTLRVWERRYGRPTPHRLPSGHRRYPPEAVRWLRRVVEALSLGHRPSRVVGLDDHALGALLEAAAAPEAHDDAELERRLAMILAFDGSGFRESLRQQLARSDLRRVILHGIAPLLIAVGRAWADGELEVRHEHYATQIVEDFLREARAGFSTPDDAVTVLLCALESEQHSLGLHMASIFAAFAGARPEIVGESLPLAEIVAAQEETGAHAVAISVSLATGGVETDEQLTTLRRALSDGVPLLIGGRGARGVRRGARGVEYVDDLDAFTLRLRQLSTAQT